MVRDTALEQKLLNTQPLLGVRPLPRGRKVHQHQLRKAQEGFEGSTLRPYGVQLLSDAVNVIIEVGIGLGVVGFGSLRHGVWPEAVLPSAASVLLGEL